MEDLSGVCEDARLFCGCEGEGTGVVEGADFLQCEWSPLSSGYTFGLDGSEGASVQFFDLVA